MFVVHRHHRLPAYAVFLRRCRAARLSPVTKFPHEARGPPDSRRAAALPKEPFLPPPATTNEGLFGTSRQAADLGDDFNDFALKRVLAFAERATSAYHEAATFRKVYGPEIEDGEFPGSGLRVYVVHTIRQSGAVAITVENDR